MRTGFAALAAAALSLSAASALAAAAPKSRRAAAPRPAAPRAAAPDAKANKDLAAAVRLYHRLDLPGALERFDAAIEAYPAWKTAAGYRAACRWTMGDQGGAV